MDDHQTVREDLGCQNTGGNTRNYRLKKELKMLSGSDNSPEPSARALCRVKFKFGLLAGQTKRIAWEFAEPLLKSNKVTWIEWITK